MGWFFITSGHIQLEIHALKGLELIMTQAQAGMQECLVFFVRGCRGLALALEGPRDRRLGVRS